MKVFQNLYSDSPSPFGGKLVMTCIEVFSNYFVTIVSVLSNKKSIKA